MAVRMACVAGQFYEASAQDCRDHIDQLISESPNPIEGLPETIISAIVPHAGWLFSGNLAAKALMSIKQTGQHVDTFVIFGAVHRAYSTQAMVYDHGQWGTPLGTIDIDEPLAAMILGESAGLAVSDTSSHSREHSIEVQVPLIQHMFEDAKIVPIMVPVTENAPKVGQAVARAINEHDKNVVCLASTDLTHYGPSYGFTNMGTGSTALKWAKEQNDAYFINLAMNLEEDNIVETSRLYGNACGPGAVAALIAATKQLGGTKSVLLGHTTSAEIVAEKFHQQSEDSVGYAAIAFG